MSNTKLHAGKTTSSLEVLKKYEKCVKVASKSADELGFLVKNFREDKNEFYALLDKDKEEVDAEFKAAESCYNENVKYIAYALVSVQSYIAKGASAVQYTVPTLDDMKKKEKQYLQYVGQKVSELTELPEDKNAFEALSQDYSVGADSRINKDVERLLEFVVKTKSDMSRDGIASAQVDSQLEKIKQTCKNIQDWSSPLVPAEVTPAPTVEEGAQGHANNGSQADEKERDSAPTLKQKVQGHANSCKSNR